MRILEGDPLDLVEIDAVVAREYAADPRAGGDGIGTNPNTLAGEIGRLQLAPLGIIGNGVMLAARHHHGRQQDVRFSGSPRLQ